MRNATAELRRQTFSAALACVLLAGMLAAGSGAARLQGHADSASDRPILARTVVLDRARLGVEAKAFDSAVAAVAAKASASAPVAINMRGQTGRPVCGGAPCQRTAALPPVPRRRPTAQSDAALVKAALTPARPELDAGAHSFSDRLLWPVGNFRNRVAGLISLL